jgi:glycosyltransferase involved in cell wall biosynthesis
MDILALPTHREGFPIVLLEAAAMERAIVATRVTGCVDAVRDGLTGTLVEPYNPEALAAGILAYVTSPALRERHGRAARVRVLQDFSDKAMRAAIYRVYMEGLAGPGWASSQPERALNVRPSP